MTGTTSTNATTPRVTRSELRSIHTARGALRQVLDDVPEYVAARAALVALQSQPVALPQVASGLDDIKYEVLQAARDCRPKPVAEILAAVQQHQDLVNAANGTRNLLDEAEGTLLSDLDGVVRDNADRLFECLHDKLQELLEQTRAILDALHGVADADAAIAAGLVESWSEYRRQEQAYADLRSAQTALISGLWSSDDMPDPRWALELRLLANPIDVFPDYPTFKAYGFTLDKHGNRQKLTAPWPDPAETPAFFRWLATTPSAQAWIPNGAQYAKASAALTQAALGGPRIVRHQPKPDFWGGTPDATLRRIG